ncbi:rbcL [Symbiodinium natans]|uniref:ribulose-bisphosphate carboxylase n=1 Tax=Symbiodinium natans TaxID=878477 RepID=A0A812M981_9DINO|nr:rbcL [Symbiodinium natans]
MAQRTSATLALGGLAGGLAYLSSGSQAFAAAPATSNLRQQRAAHAAQAPASSASTSLPAMMAGGAVLAAAAASGRTSRSHGSTPLPTTVPVRKSATARKALDQSSRYADLSLDEATLIKNGKHVLVAYIMKPKAGYDYLATAAHFAAESSTGTNVNVCTTDDFTKSVDALVYYIDPDSEEMKIAYPNLLFDRNIIDGRAMMCSFLTLSIGNNQGMGDVEYGKIYDFYLPPEFLRLYDGPAVNVEDMWRILGKGTSNGGLVVGTIIKPKLGLQPKPFGEACYAFWQGGDFIKNDEPQGNQVFCQMNEVIPEVVKAMRACIKETGVGKLFSANITADDPNEMIARGKYCLSQFGPLSENCAFLVDGYVAGGTAVTCARRNFPGQFLHYHRAGHGSVTSPQTQRGYTAFVHTKISRVIGASGIHTGTMSFGKMEGDASDKNIAFMLQDDAADGPYYHQPWEGMKQTTPIISGGMNALRLPAFFENLGHSNVILTAGGGSFGHKDGPKPGAVSCRQGEEAWKAWKAGQYGNISLSDGVIEFAKTHEEIKGAFLTFQKDADQIYPGWKEKLGYTGESSVQAASFDWAKKASAAAFVGCSAPERTVQVARAVTPYELQENVYADLEFTNDVGYLPDGTPMNRAGNAINHPETIGPDSHAPGSPLPRAHFVNSVGYLPDGTPLNAAGNAINHPETMQPDAHTPGSPLPASAYAADIGYLVDGTPMETAGNNSVRGGAAPAAAPAQAPVVAAAAFVGSSAATPSKVRHAGNFAYSFQKDSWADLEFSNDIGYLPDGTPMNKAGNAINHPENIQPDSHAPGSPLPSAIFVNDVGYLPDGTPLNKAGNAINHPENIQPDLHTPGSPLPASVYAQDVGYLVDGTPMSTAGNLSVQQ